MSRLLPVSGCDTEERKVDVVFVHGLGGDAYGSWRSGKDESTSWPHWLGEEFPDIGVWTLSYAASPTKWAGFKRLIGLGNKDSGHSMALPDRALQTLDLLSQNCLGQRPMMFVCHSLGGLLVKMLLRKSNDSLDFRKKEIANQTSAVLFLATPHTGSDLASLADAFRRIFGSTVSIEDLRAHDSHLRDLYDWYRNHAPRLGIKTTTYYENRRYKGLLIVNPTSAHPGVGSNPVNLDEDHISISKPSEKRAQVCGAASEIIQNILIGDRHATIKSFSDVSVRPEGAIHPEVAGKLFDTVHRQASVIDRLISHSSAPYLTRDDSLRGQDCDASRASIGKPAWEDKGGGLHQYLWRTARCLGHVWRWG